MANVQVLVEAITESAEESLEEVGESLEGTGAAGEEAAEGMESTEATADDVEEAMEGVGDASGSASGGLNDAADGLFEIDKAGVAASAGLAAAGAAMQQVLDKSADMRETLGRAAVSAGMTRDEIQNLATDVSDATFPIEDAVATVDLLTQAGIESEERIRELSTSFDTLADATGATAEEVTDAVIPAIRLLEGDLSNADEHMDTFAFVARNTTMSVSDFASVINRVGPQMREMGLSINETAALLATMEDQGLTGTQAMRELRQGMREADGDMDALLETLDLSTDALNENRQAVAEAEGTTREHADAANESLTAMDELRNSWQEATLQAGKMLEPVNAAAPALQGLGMAGMFLSTVNLGAVVPSISAVMASLAPILPILLAAAGIIAFLAMAWESNFLGIQNITDSVIGTVMDNLDLIKKVLLALMGPLGWLLLAWESNFLGIQQKTEAAAEALSDAFDWLTDQIDKAISWIMDKIWAIPDVIADVVDAIPGVDSEDVMGDLDPEELKEQAFPPKPGEEGEEVGEAMGEGVQEGMDEEVDGPPSPDDFEGEGGPTAGSSGTGTDTGSRAGAGDGAGGGSRAGASTGAGGGGGGMDEEAKLHLERMTLLLERIWEEFQRGVPGDGGTVVNVDVAGDLDDDPYTFSRNLADQVTRELRSENGT